MPNIKFVSHDSVETRVSVEVGSSVMEAAIEAGVVGMLAECGGTMCCATCQCCVDCAWTDEVGKPGEMESQMLEMTSDQRPGSRLSCQIVMQENLDGLIVHLPKYQI